MRGCLSVRCIALLVCLVATLVSITTVWVLVKFAFPVRRGFYLETEYRYTLLDSTTYELRWSWSELYNPRERRIRPLIEDVPQLHYYSIPREYKTYDEWLTMNRDGTAWYPGREYWIYFAGTSAGSDAAGLAPDGSASNNAAGACSSDGGCGAAPLDGDHGSDTFSHRYKKHSCPDPPHVCNEFNAAFNRISARWHGTEGPDGQPQTTNALLRHANCDVTPLICDDIWGIGGDPVMLAHVKVGDECEDSMGTDRCPVTWRFIALPIDNPPWTRQIGIPLDKGGSTVVPAFPDAEEQMWSLMAHPGAEEGLIYDDPDTSHNWNAIVTIEPVEGETPRVSEPLGIVLWAMFRSIVDNPFHLEEWPMEPLVKCYVERWTDILLKWWDGEPDIFPRSCNDLEEEGWMEGETITQIRDRLSNKTR